MARHFVLDVQEIQRYNVDIATLSETRLVGDGASTEEKGGYSFFWKEGITPRVEPYTYRGICHWVVLLRFCPENPAVISARLMKLITLTCNF